MNINLVIAWKIFNCKGLNWSYVDSSSSLIRYIERNVDFEKEMRTYGGNARKTLKELYEWDKALTDHSVGYKVRPAIFRFWTFRQAAWEKV